MDIPSTTAWMSVEGTPLATVLVCAIGHTLDYKQFLGLLQEDYESPEFVHS